MIVFKINEADYIRNPQMMRHHMNLGDGFQGNFVLTIKTGFEALVVGDSMPGGLLGFSWTIRWIHVA